MIIKKFPDKEKAKSMLELATMREEYVRVTDFSKFPTGKAENFYEIVKEFSNILLLLKGYKATGENAHKDIFDFLLKEKIINEEECQIVQDLRLKRNYSMYEGKQVPQSYLDRKEEKIKEIISKLKKLIEKEL